MLQKRRRLFHKTTAAALALLLFASVFMMSAGATSAWPRGEIPHRVHSWYENIPVHVQNGDRRVSDCYLINETTYAPLRSLCDAVLPAAKIDFNAATRTARVSADGLYLTAQEGSHYIVANGRYLYSDTPVLILDDGRTYIPIRSLAKALGVGIVWNAASRSVTVTGAYAPILSGDRFYDADAVYWLSRIISAESQGEPLLGQIAVGNVVLNRVAHKDFPNTIWGVIFDRRFGVQFTPVANGSVYREPYYLSVIAAKLCLEGVTVSDRVLYFMNPAISTSFWIPSHRPYAFRIGTHQFYY